MQSFDAVILAGGMRASPLTRLLGVPVLVLPLSPEQSLLSEWLDCLAQTAGCRTVTILGSRPADVDLIRAHLTTIVHCGRVSLPVDVRLDCAPWRGTAGCVRDVIDSTTGSEWVLVGESACLPPPTLTPLLAPLDSGAAGTVGVASGTIPAGAYAFAREALALVPRIGFCDIKEQLLPALHRRSMAARPAAIADRALRLWDRAGYLDAVVAMRDIRRAPPSPAISLHLSRDLEDAVIGRNVLVDRTAVIHDSVVLDGARVGARAIVTRSVVGFDAAVASGTHLSNTIVASNHSATDAQPVERVPLGTSA